MKKFKAVAKREMVAEIEIDETLMVSKFGCTYRLAKDFCAKQGIENYQFEKYSRMENGHIVWSVLIFTHTEVEYVEVTKQ